MTTAWEMAVHAARPAGMHLEQRVDATEMMHTSYHRQGYPRFPVFGRYHISHIEPLSCTILAERMWKQYAAPVLLDEACTVHELYP